MESERSCICMCRVSISPIALWLSIRFWNWYDNVVFLLSIVWTGTTMWYFSYLLCELVRQCGISLIYCVNCYDSVVFLLSIVWTGTKMWYFSYLLCELVRQCGISLIYCVNWYNNVVFLLSRTWYSIASQPVFSLTPAYWVISVISVISEEAANANFIVQTWPRLEPPIYYHARSEHGNHCTTDTVQYLNIFTTTRLHTTMYASTNELSGGRLDCNLKAEI
jgi:predicted outer membrane lipoprotein